jgi:hypothetical protein
MAGKIMASRIHWQQQFSITTQQNAQGDGFFYILHGTYVRTYNWQCIRLAADVWAYMEPTQGDKSLHIYKDKAAG